VELSAADCASIAEAGEAQVDLAGQEVRWTDGASVRAASFEIDAEIKHRLLTGSTTSRSRWPGRRYRRLRA